MWKDIRIFIVKIITVIGSVIAIWYGIRKAREKRFAEKSGEKEFDAYEKALSLIQEVKHIRFTRPREDPLSIIETNHEWVNENRFFFS
jgi:hypothetical protein